MARAREKKQIAKNRKAFHDYEIIETFEAGIALTGTEVCSLRENNCQLTDCFVLIRKGEAWLNGLPYLAVFAWQFEQSRPRPQAQAQAAASSQADSLFGAENARGGTGNCSHWNYFSTNGLVKLEIALARGKKLHDKRQAMAERDSKREIARALKMRSR